MNNAVALSTTFFGEGKFCFNDKWLVVIPKGSYPVLVGQIWGNFQAEARWTVKPLTYVMGFDAGEDVKRFEYLTKHEYEVILDREPEMALWLVKQSLWNE